MLFNSNRRNIVLFFSFIVLAAILIISISFFLSHNLPYGKINRNITVNNGLIYQVGSSLPFTGKILDTLESKMIIEYDVVNGLKNGEYCLSTLEGIFTVHGFCNNGKNVGRWQYFYENGNLECIGNFDDDKPSGYWIWYHQNGARKCDGIFNNGQREGKWSIYDEDGHLNTIKYYRSDEVISAFAIDKLILI